MRFCLVVPALLSLACSPSDEEAPAIEEVVPARIAPGVATGIAVHGRHFYGLATVDLGDKQSAHKDDAFLVRIGDVAVASSDVSQQSTEELSVQLPPMSEGTYDVVVTLPDSRTATLPAGLRVGADSRDAGQGGSDGSPGGDAGPNGDANPSLNLLETITVPVNGTEVVSAISLDAGGSYVLRASGTFDITGAGTIADAEYADFSALPDSLLDTISGVDFGIAVDDPVVDMVRTPKWGAFDASHIYQIAFVGSGGPITVNFHDANPGNNTGSLTLEILQ